MKTKEIVSIKLPRMICDSWELMTLYIFLFLFFFHLD